MTNFNSWCCNLWRHAIAVFIVFISSSLVAYAEVPADIQTETWWQGGALDEGGELSVKRSSSDERAYRYLKLSNGIKVLLISDPDTDKAAASLNVNVGSFQNPLERDGLAHFLEHMLFLGTDKYPQAGAYQLFISEHGGRHNAYTSMEDTNYFFGIDAEYLFAALDRFSRFFVAPLFDEAYVDRERNAVDSEFRLKLKDDSRREWEVFGEQVSPTHPLSRFSVGNLETLADREDHSAREDLLAFYKKYYSAERMTLVVLGRETLEQLEEEVRSRFSAVPNNADSKTMDSGLAKADLAKADLVKPDLIKKDTVLTLQKPLPLELDIQPIKDQRTLSIVFPMPGVAKHWRTKPSVYWGHVLGDESEGSLIALLKKAGLANGLSAGLVFDTSQGAMFVIEMDLTPAGVSQKSQVLDSVFAWLNLAREQGLARWRFDELAKLQQTNFQFIEEYAPESYVHQLSPALRHYPPEEVLRGPFWLSEFDKQILADFVGRLRPDNAVVMLVAPEVKKTTRTSIRYGAPYLITPVDTETRSRWAVSVVKKLSLAPANPYIAKSYPLSDKGGASNEPVKLDSKMEATVWHYTDQQFGSPRGIFEARIASPEVHACANAARTDLYLAIVRDTLRTKTYQANLAGLGFSLYRWNNGIGITVNGYVERQQVLLDQVLNTMANPQWQAQSFVRLRDKLVRDWRNSRKEWPVKQLFAQLGPLVKGACDAIVLADALETVTIEDLQLFYKTIYKKGHARFYAGGVLSIEQALAMADATVSKLKVGENGDVALFEKVVQLPEKLTTGSVHVDHADHSVLLYIQGDEDTLGERANMAIINTILEAPFYTTMRTEKQLGYVVGTNIMHMNRVPGVGLYIQSPHSSVQQLEQYINEFLIGFEETLTSLNEVDLQRFKSALLANIEEKPHNVLEQAARHQESLYLGYDDFQFRKKLVEQVKVLSLSGLQEAYRRLFMDGSRRLWLVTSHVEPTQAVLKHDDLVATDAGIYSYPE